MSYPTKDSTPVELTKLGDGPYDPILPPPPGGYPPTEPTPLSEGQFPGVNSNAVTRGNKGGNKNSWKGKGGKNKKPIYKFTHVTADCGDGIEAYFPLVLNPLHKNSFVFDPTPPATCTWKDLTIYNDVQTIAEDGFLGVDTDGSINFLASNLTIGDRAFKDYGPNSKFVEFQLDGYKFGESSFEFCGINNAIALVNPDISEAPRCFFGSLFDGDYDIRVVNFGNRIPVSFASSSQIGGVLLQNDADYLIAGSAFSSNFKLKRLNFADENCVVIGESAFNGANITESISFCNKTAVFGNDCFIDSIEGAELLFSPQLDASALAYAGNGFPASFRLFYPGCFRGSTLTQEVLVVGPNNAATRLYNDCFAECKASNTQFSAGNPGFRFNIAAGAFSGSDFRNFYLECGQIEVEHNAFNSCNTHVAGEDVAIVADTFVFHDFAFKDINKGSLKLTEFKFPGLTERGDFVGIKTFEQKTRNRVAWSSKSDGELLAYSILPNAEIFRNPALNQGFNDSRVDTSDDEKSTIINTYEDTSFIPCFFTELNESFIDQPALAQATAFHFDHVARMGQFGANGVWWTDSPAIVKVTIPDGREVTLEQEEVEIGNSTVKQYRYLWEEISEEGFTSFVSLDYVLSTDEFWETSFVEGQFGPNPTTVQPFGGTDTLNIPGGWVLSFSVTVDPIEPGDPIFSSPVTKAGYKWHREGNPSSFIPLVDWETYITPDTTGPDLEPPSLSFYSFAEEQETTPASVSWRNSSGDLSKVETDIVFEDYDDARNFKRKHLICGTVNGL